MRSSGHREQISLELSYTLACELRQQRDDHRSLVRSEECSHGEHALAKRLSCSWLSCSWLGDHRR